MIESPSTPFVFSFVQTDMCISSADLSIIPLNATGRSWVSKTSVTKLGLREGHDVIDSAFTSSSTTSAQYNYLYFRSSEYSGFTSDPYLEVTYTQPIENPEPTTKTVTYAYDHGMRRVAKKSDTSNTIYPTSEYALTDGVSTTYVSGPSGIAASIEQHPSTGSESSTIHTDHLGSTSVVTDAQGIMNELLDYHAYGTERMSWSSGESGEAQAQRKYIGEYADEETDLSYLHARYYDPERGQFLSQDPIFLGMGDDSTKDKRLVVALLDPQSQNSYSYARNNPMRFSDTNGESWFSDRIESTANVFDSAFNFITVGAGDKIDDMLKNGVTPGKVAGLVAGVAFGAAATSAAALAVGATAGAAYVAATPVIAGTASVIGATGKIGEDFLRTLGGVSQKYFSTSLGGRYIDQFVNGVANESKVGYTYLTKDIALQIAKDAELISNRVISSSIWHFFTSSVTGSGGASKPLLDALMKAGIEVITHTQ